MHSDELITGELIIPRKVTKYGEFLAHNLSHHHGEHYKHHRRRRSFEDVMTTAAAAEPEVHYQLQLKNETIHLELE